jgi:hypothetical protein
MARALAPIPTRCSVGSKKSNRIEIAGAPYDILNGCYTQVGQQFNSEVPYDPIKGTSVVVYIDRTTFTVDDAPASFWAVAIVDLLGYPLQICVVSAHSFHADMRCKCSLMS